MMIASGLRLGPGRISTHIYSHYNILSDIVLILDHGNICVDTIFMIIIMHSFPDIEARY